MFLQPSYYINWEFLWAIIYTIWISNVLENTDIYIKLTTTLLKKNTFLGSIWDSAALSEQIKSESNAQFS